MSLFLPKSQPFLFRHRSWWSPHLTWNNHCHLVTLRLSSHMPPNSNEKRLRPVAASESTHGGKSVSEQAPEWEAPAQPGLLTPPRKPCTFYSSEMTSEPRMKSVWDFSSSTLSTQLGNMIIIHQCWAQSGVPGADCHLQIIVDVRNSWVSVVCTYRQRTYIYTSFLFFF